MRSGEAAVTKFENMPELADFGATSHWLSVRGWSEAAGGNMSVRLDTPPDTTKGEPQELPFSVPYLAGKALLLTGSGTRTRETALFASRDVGLYRIEKNGTSYSWLAGNNTPTSELPAHCAIHNALAEHRPEDKAILHTHPANLVALCHAPGLASGLAISDKVLRLQSEALLHLPEGIGYVPHQIPGSLELGLASAKLVEKYRLVLWHMHGCLATGKDLATAFDYMEVFQKCAVMYWTLRSANIDPDGMSDDDIEKTLRAFNRFEIYRS